MITYNNDITKCFEDEVHTNHEQETTKQKNNLKESMRDDNL